MANLEYRPVSSAEAKMRVREALTSHPGAEIRVLAGRARLTVHRTAVILAAYRACPEPGVIKARLIADALKRKRS